MGNISWLGNRVLDPNASRGFFQPASTPQQPSYDKQEAVSTSQSVPVQQNNIDTREGPPPSTEEGYIPHYLSKNIGKFVRAEFIIGNSYLDKTGRLVEVGVNYFVLEDENSRTNIMCDLYSVKFVTVLQP